MSSRKRKDKYLFNIEDYKVIRCIKHGGFGVINLVRNKTSGENFAAKTNLIQTETQNKLFISREVRILIQIQHPTIIRFRGFSYTDFDNKKNTTILMDYMKEGSLADLIDKEMKSLCSPDYDNTKRQIILVGIARGMMILHQHHVIHRDLKPENILLDSNFHPYITDFGLSKFFDPYHSMNQSISNSGTAAYMAPEVINGDHFNSKADVFAFGILMYEVIAGERAYEDVLKGKKKLNDFQFKTKITQGLRPKIDKKIHNKYLRKLIEKCWTNDPKERPSFTEIFQKLSLSCDDYFLEFEDNYQEPKIIDDDDDDDDDENKEEIGINKKYCLDDVDYDEFLNYVDEIKEEPKTINETKNNEVDKLKKEISKLKDTISTMETNITSKFEDKIKSLNKTIKEQSSKISELETKLKNESHLPLNRSHLFYAEMSLTEPGILCLLKKQEKSPFDRLFIASQSSNDIYNIIDPNTDEKFSSAQFGNFFIEFELEEPVEMNGIKIFSDIENLPRSFNIEIERQTVKKIKDANELNGQLKEMTIKFNLIQSKKIRFVQTGPNWDGNNNYLHIKRIEILSNDPKYSKGIFSSLIELNESHDPHKCAVKITASYFDLNDFYSLDAKSSVWTYSYENSWFQIELTNGLAVLNGFRIKKVEMKCFKIICTNNEKEPIESWTELININEKEKSKNKINIIIYKFPHPSPPIRFIRLIQTGPDWNDNLSLFLYHIDFFGCYF